MNNKKFRVWNTDRKQFEYFELGNIKSPVWQFIGILDKNMKEIYEGDVVKCIYGLEGLEILGEVQYSYDLCAYVVDWHHLFSDIELDSLEIVGNMVEDYMWDVNGTKLLKMENL